MRDLTTQEKIEVERMTKDFAAKCKTHPTKGKYIFGQSKSIFSGSASGSVSFSADTGNKADFSVTDFSRDEETCFKELNPIEKCKRIVFNAEAKAQAEAYAKKRNQKLRAVKDAIKRRFDFRQHDSK